MNKRVIFTWIFVALGVLLQAQGPAPEIPIAIPRFVVLMDSKAQNELKLTDDQRKRVEAFLSDRKQGSGIRINAGDDIKRLEAEAAKILSEAQRKRLEELWIQREGGLTLSDDAVAKALGLTDEQRRRIRLIGDDMREESKQLAMSGSDAEDRRVDMKKIRQEAGHRMVSVLTLEQKAKFDRMKGKILEGRIRSG